MAYPPADVELLKDLVERWHATRRWAEGLICKTFEVSSASEFSQTTRERGVPRTGLVPGTQWHYQLHGAGMDLRKEGNRGGIDYDFARSEPDGGRLREFLIKQLNDGALTKKLYRPMLQDSKRWEAAVRELGIDPT